MRREDGGGGPHCGTAARPTRRGEGWVRLILISLSTRAPAAYMNNSTQTRGRRQARKSGIPTFPPLRLELSPFRILPSRQEVTMSRLCHGMVWVPLLAIAGLARGEGRPPAAPPPGAVTAVFHDGTVIRQVALPESVEVLTKYGRLTVPVRDIKRVEVGF